MSEQHLRSNERTVLSGSQPAADHVRKNVLWSATLELADRSIDCVITSISAHDATIYISQWTKCRGPVELQNSKLGSVLGEVAAQDENQVTLIFHETAQRIISRIISAI